MRQSDSNLGEQMPPDSRDLRGRQRFRRLPWKHSPETVLKRRRCRRVRHFVRADDALLRDHLAELRLLELLPRHERQHDAIGPREEQLAGVMVVLGADERGVALEEIGYALGQLTALLERVQRPHETAFRLQRGLRAIHRVNLVDVPILDLEHEQTATRIEDDEIGMTCLAADRDVVPDQ
jgi:hypothetical protein